MVAIEFGVRPMVGLRACAGELGRTRSVYPKTRRRRVIFMLNRLRTGTIDRIALRDRPCVWDAPSMSSGREEREAVTRVEADGSVVFQVYLPHATRLSLCGTFNGWSRTSHALNRDGDSGWWRLRLQLPPGEHAFQYLIDGREWIADYAAFGVEMNEFGGWVSRIVVPERRPRLVAAPEIPAPMFSAAIPGAEHRFDEPYGEVVIMPQRVTPQENAA